MSPLFVIFLTVFIDMVGFGIVIPVLPLYAEHFHATPVQIGWLTGIYSGMQIIFVPILGRLSDRFGRRPDPDRQPRRHRDWFSDHGVGLVPSAPFSRAHHRWRQRRQHRNRAGLHRGRQHPGKSLALDGLDRRGLRPRIHAWSDDRWNHEPHFLRRAFLLRRRPRRHQRCAPLLHPAGEPFRRISFASRTSALVSRKFFSTATAAFSAPSWPRIFSRSPASPS